MPSTRLFRIVRRLVRAPLFSAVAILTLAVGIGANTAIFSVVNGVLLKPLPFADPERLVGVWHTAPGIDIPILSQGPTNYFVYRDENRSFEDFALWDGAAVSITGTGEPERVQALRVTDGVFGILRVDPAVGRSFAREDDIPGAPDRVMLAHGYWQRTFGGDRTAVGRTLVVEGTPHEIIGVLPEGFRFLDRHAQVFLPFRFNRAEVHVGNFSYQGIARLKPGVTIEQANGDIARMLPLTVERFPLPPGISRQMFDEARLGPLVRPLSQDVIGDIGQMLWILLGTVGLVLLIACANVANLFLVRAEGRQQELAIHSALGASWKRIAWELMSESLTIALLGGAVGLGLAYAGIRMLGAIAPDGLPRIQEIAIDPIVLAFTLAISLVAGVLFGVIPVVKFARPQLAGALKEGGRASSAGKARHRARNTLVVAEIALAVVLLVASGLMIRTFQAMQRVDPGFTRPEEVLTMRVSIPNSLVADPIQTAACTSRLPGASHRCPACGRWVSPPRSPWTASTATIRSSSRTSRPPRAGSRRCAGTSGPAPGTSKRWATASWPGARSTGTTRIPKRTSRCSPRTWRASSGRIRRSRLAVASAADRRRRGGRSSGSSATSTTMASRSRLRRSSTGRSWSSICGPKASRCSATWRMRSEASGPAPPRC
ncbi:MAG: ABC transporter permease [Vicinamibacterales bacterium]